MHQHCLRGRGGLWVCGSRPCGPGARSSELCLKFPETCHEAPGAWSLKPPHLQRSKSECRWTSEAKSEFPWSRHFSQERLGPNMHHTDWAAYLDFRLVLWSGTPSISSAASPRLQAWCHVSDKCLPRSMWWRWACQPLRHHLWLVFFSSCTVNPQGFSEFLHEGT